MASFKSWLIHLDASKTGAAFAVCIAAWVSALWVTRHWARTDRDFYRSELQKAYAQASALIRSAVEVDTDQQWGHIKQAIDEFEKNAFGWVERTMGSVAACKLAEANRSSHSYEWKGNHDPAARKQRDRCIDQLKDRQNNIHALMESSSWDDPTPLRKRERERRWKAKMKWLSAKLGRRPVSNAS
ncbi:MAG: hypothetical protein OC190_05935 [Novosphingobium aromaticivorans]|nr:hypothetical protein [Novosphingobium aromaticivorans]